MRFLLALYALALHAQSPDDVARGKKLFQGHCGLCHGQTGEGGRGPNLTLPNLKNGNSLEALERVISEGVPGTEMPGSWQLSPREVKQVASYLQSISRTQKVALPGDAARGRTLFSNKGGCAACHIVRGQGTGLGPELTLIGVRRTAPYLRQALLEPAATLPDGYQLLTATKADGAKISGRKVNEDAFTLQIMDGAGRYHSLRKSALRALERHEGKSAMPAYAGKLTTSEIDDLVEYMASLRGEE